jgi:hemin uptake protein HemP
MGRLTVHVGGEEPLGPRPRARSSPTAWRPPEAPRGTAGTHPRAVASDDLFQGLRELVILHRNEEYRLRITRAGKLILTK